jgi:hypothetical protein
MSTTTEQKKLIVGGNTSANITNTWWDLSAYDDVSVQINHKSGNGSYKIGASNEYDAARNPNPTSVDLTASLTFIGGTAAVAGAANLLTTLTYPCAHKAICVSYTATSGGGAAGTDVTVNAKG